MQRKIVIVGAGFAGVWSALSAKRLINIKEEKEIEVVVIAPEATLVMRPRLYEANPSSMFQPLAALFESAGIKFIQGTVQSIDTAEHTVDVRSMSGNVSSVSYTRLILAAGSTVIRPASITGLQEYAFDTDSIESATKLEAHLKSLKELPPSSARNNIVVCGAGFTGIEVATELPRRLGQDTDFRIILVGNAAEVGPDLGPGPRPVITRALKDLGIDVKLGSAVARVDAEGITLASGERIETMTAIWTAGVKATHLTKQISGDRDSLSRLHVDQNLRVTSCKHVFATGDAAHAAADTEGHVALMSCQHATPLGRVSGYNAAADLLGEPMVPYAQAAYGTCLDLGAWGAVVGMGWERKVVLERDMGKRVKTFINQKGIYPPQDAGEAIAAATPTIPDNFFEQVVLAAGVSLDSKS